MTLYHLGVVWVVYRVTVSVNMFNYQPCDFRESGQSCSSAAAIAFRLVSYSDDNYSLADVRVLALKLLIFCCQIPDKQLVSALMNKPRE